MVLLQKAEGSKVHLETERRNEKNNRTQENTANQTWSHRAQNNKVPQKPPELLRVYSFAIWNLDRWRPVRCMPRPPHNPGEEHTQTKPIGWIWLGDLSFDIHLVHERLALLWTQGWRSRGEGVASRGPGPVFWLQNALARYLQNPSSSRLKFRAGGWENQFCRKLLFGSTKRGLQKIEIIYKIYQKKRY